MGKKVTIKIKFKKASEIGKTYNKKITTFIKKRDIWKKKRPTKNTKYA